MILSKVQMIGALAALAAAFGAGVQIGAWKKGAEFVVVQGQLQDSNTALRDQIDVLNQDVAKLKATIQEQNSAVALLEAQTEAAKGIQAEAQKRADGLQLVSKKRMDRIEALLPDAKVCADILIPYWSERQ